MRGVGAEGTDHLEGLRLTVPLRDRRSEFSLGSARTVRVGEAHGLVALRQSADIRVHRATHDMQAGHGRMAPARQVLRLTAEKLEIERSTLLHGVSPAFRFTRFEERPVHARNAEADALADCEEAPTPLDRTPGATPETRDIAVEQARR